MANGIDQDPTGIHRVLKSKNNPEAKKRRRDSSHRLAKSVGILAAGGVLAAFGAKELSYDPRQEALAKQEQTQADFYAQAKEGNKPLETTGTTMFISAPANIRENSGTFAEPWFPLVRPDNVIMELEKGQELQIVDGIARDYGFKWVEFRLRDATRVPKPNSAAEFGDSIVAIRYQELAAQGLVTVCKMPGKGEHTAYIDPNWVLRGADGDPEVANGSIVDVHQAATTKGAYPDGWCEVIK